MFGYIKPFKPQMKMCEYEIYKAVYCGLCGQLGKSFGAVARLTLSYDFTFLCMLHGDAGGIASCFEKRRCYVNPLKQQMTRGENESLQYAADTAILMLYYKLLDNMHDGGTKERIGGRLALPVVRKAHKKAAAARPETEAIIARSMQEQAALESRGCDSLDEASEPTAAAMSGICGLLSGDDRQRRVLERLGYLVGRYVYLCDAVDDLEEDVAGKGYNPLALRYGVTADTPTEALNDVYRAGRESLYATIAEAAKTFALLDQGPFHPILDNVFSMGMQHSVNEILSKKERNP